MQLNLGHLGLLAKYIAQPRLPKPIKYVINLS
jgi:hypothetical protein